MTANYLAWRYLKAGRGLMNLSTTLSIVGMVIGVGSLVVAMAVVSGYESTLKRTVIDVTGHLVVARTSGPEDPQLFKEMLSSVRDFTAYTPYVFLEAVLAHQGKLSGVAVEGVDEATVHQVLNLKSRLAAGEFNLRRQDDASAALIGKGLARKHSLKVGDQFRVVLPASARNDQGRVKPRVSRFFVAGILDMGRHDFDERYLLTDLATAQNFAQIGQQVSGYRFRLKNDDLALTLGPELNERFRSRYDVRNWYAVNRNLFHAIEYEKPVIFFVLLVIVVAAAFNICSTLFVSVIRRFRDISILKSMGASKGLIIRVFAAQGVMIGVIGSILGVLLGLLACGLFMWVQNYWSLMPAEVYKLDRITIELRFWDLMAILGASWVISFLATLGPARRGAALPPVEGLRYE
ncbi:MAG: ABC transporter permease [Bdellovibrionales bacterium]